MPQRGGGGDDGDGNESSPSQASAPMVHSAGSLQFTLPKLLDARVPSPHVPSTPAPDPWSQREHWLKPPREHPRALQKSSRTAVLLR
jgi:hypothetical protein